MSKAVIELVQPQEDGIGAQLFRIVSAYAIACKWKTFFKFHPIKSIDGQIFGQPDQDTDVWNSFLSSFILLKTNIEYENRIRYRNQHPLVLYPSISFRKILSEDCIHVIDSPQITTNIFPKYLEDVGFSNNFMKIGQRHRIQVVVHVRQGEAMLSQFVHRFTPLAYFENILSELVSIFKHFNLPYNVIVLVEPNQQKLISSDEPKLQQSLRLNPNNPWVHYVGNGFYLLRQELPSESETPNLFASEWRDSGTAWLDFQTLLQSDIVVTSKSTFSYTAGIINKSALVIYTDFWHPKLPSWISSSERGFREKLSQRIVSKFVV